MKRLISLILTLIIAFSLSFSSFAENKNDHINTGDLKEDILAIASTQIGYVQENDSSKYESAVSDSFDNWSSAFLAWCANEASAPEDVIPRTANVKNLYDFYKSNTSVYTPDEHFPSVGDIIFLSKDEEINLCGIVIATDEEYITAIVGGEDNTVKKKMYAVTLSKIYAYASPDYTLEAEYKPGKYMTTASALNFREEPTTSSQVICTIPLGTIVTITSISGEWGKISYNNTEGWINLQYVVPYDDTHNDTSEYAVKWNVIDISKWQGNIKWEKIAAADIDAVIIRIGLRGTATKEIHMDDKFFEYYEGAVNAGLHVGCYFYSAATTEDEAKEEAYFIIDTIRENDLNFDMPVYLDMEDKVVEKTGKTQIFNTTKAFLDVMKEENVYSGVYCSTSWAEDYYNPALFNGHSLWIADWRNQCKYSGEYGMWQYTEYGSVSGIDANYTDLNICYINYPVLITDLGYNKDLDTVERKKGDVNADGKVNATDARTALRASAKLVTLRDKAKTAADMDDDGNVSAADARKILRISAKLE